MKKFILSSTLLILFSCGFIWAGENDRILLDFSGKTAEENHVTLQGAGFGQYPEAAVTFGYIPTDNAFDGATDGIGAVITAQPGEGVMIFGQKLKTPNTAMIRCSLRTDRANAAVTIASIGNQPDEFIATNHPNNEAYFVGQYLRLATFCIPPSTGFQPVIQILNTSQTETLTAYLDKFEICFIDPNRYYSGTFLDGDTIDPPLDKICLPSDSDAGVAAPANVPSNVTIDLGQITASIAMDMIYIATGTFTMGSPGSEPNRMSDEGPQHQVTITKPFYIGKYEVTQGQWQAVMGNNPASGNGVSNNCPVYNVSWNDCQEFIQRINTLGKGTFRLPTEAEWEYACRAGTSTAFHWGDDTGYTQIGKYEWYDCTKTNFGKIAHNVGSKLSNPWGLYDVGGNVAEWCQDAYGSYSSSDQIDPQGPASGQLRILRGGSWIMPPNDCRSATRYSNRADTATVDTGLRLVKQCL